MKKTVKRLLVFLLAMAVVLVSVPLVAASEGITEEGLTYIIENSEVTVTGVQGKCVELIIPEEIEGLPVTKIAEKAFEFNNYIRSAYVPDSVLSIEDYAFDCCENMQNIRMPERLEDFGLSVFQGCHSLESIVIPERVTEIGALSFLCCEALTDIKFPQSLVSIGGEAFSGCISLESVTFPENLEYVGYGAFQHCYMLRELVLPDKVKTLDNYAFSGCDSVEKIYFGRDFESYGAYSLYGIQMIKEFEVSEENKLYSTVDGVLFDNSQETLMFYPKGRADMVYTVPEGVKTIGTAAFRYSLKLNEIVLPDSIKNIERDAFEECANLTKLLLQIARGLRA